MIFVFFALTATIQVFAEYFMSWEAEVEIKARSIGQNFTQCSHDPRFFSRQNWFSDFYKHLQSIPVNSYYGDLFNQYDICFSDKLQKVIVSVLSVNNPEYHDKCTEDKDTYVPCKDTLNIFSYDIIQKKFTQALRDPQTIVYFDPRDSDPKKWQIILHLWNENINWFQEADTATALIDWFGQEKQGSVFLNSGYWDGGCSEEYEWKYDYINNIISLFKSKFYCADDNIAVSSLPQTGPAKIFLLVLFVLSVFFPIKRKYIKL